MAMKVRQCIYVNNSWIDSNPDICDIHPSLILIFGSIHHDDNQKLSTTHNLLKVCV